MITKKGYAFPNYENGGYAFYPEKGVTHFAATRTEPTHFPV